MTHPYQIQSLDKSNYGHEDRKRGKKQKLKKKGPMKVERNAKNPVASGGGVLGCKEFHSSFRNTQGPTRTRIFNSDSTQSLKSSIWFMHGNHVPTVFRNHPSFSKFSKSDSRQHLTDLVITSGIKESTTHQTFYRDL